MFARLSHEARDIYRQLPSLWWRSISHGARHSHDYACGPVTGPVDDQFHYADAFSSVHPGKSDSAVRRHGEECERQAGFRAHIHVDVE